MEYNVLSLNNPIELIWLYSARNHVKTYPEIPPIITKSRKNRKKILVNYNVQNQFENYKNKKNKKKIKQTTIQN